MPDTQAVLIATTTSPTLEPPIAAETVGAVFQNRRIDALWSTSEIRNAHANVTGIGWKKLANTSDSCFTALSLLAALAKQTQSRVDYRDEADGMIHELYIF